MGYELGIDVGTTTTAAALCHDDGSVELLALGSLANSMPTVVHLQHDATLVVGEAAVRRGAIDVGGAARDFKRRLGDPTPLILQNAPLSAQTLMAKVVEFVFARAIEQTGEPPRAVALSHPANWTAYKTDLFRQAIQAAGIPSAFLLSEPEAAAIAYNAQMRLPEGAVVAIYDLGGGTFDAVVLRRVGDRFQQFGTGVGVDRLGGIDFDEAIFDFVRGAVGDRWPSDPSDPSLPAPMQQLRRACTEAKEFLSDDLDAVIPVVLPGVSRTVVLTRDQFESMINPAIGETMDALDTAISSAALRPGELRAVVAVGGSSRIPLVRRRLTERYGALASVDLEPTFAVARGAALAAFAARAAASPGPPRPSVAAPRPANMPPPNMPPPNMPPPNTAPLGVPAFAASPPATIAAHPTAGAPAPAAGVTESAPAHPSVPSAGGAGPGATRAVWALLVVASIVMALAGPYKMLRRDADGSGAAPVVQMAGLTFTPRSLVVASGTTVLFDNNDVAPHTVTSDDGTVDSGTLRPGATFTLVISQRFEYSCAIHPGMTAVVDIEA